MKRLLFLAAAVLGSSLLAGLDPAPAAARAERGPGERAFQRCYSCHSLDAAEADLSGPNLDRLIGKPIAADRNYDYSPAFRQFARREKRWTRPLLDRFIADPEALVPKNSMAYFGVKDAATRRNIVDHIAADR